MNFQGPFINATRTIKHQYFIKKKKKRAVYQVTQRTYKQRHQTVHHKPLHDQNRSRHGKLRNKSNDELKSGLIVKPKNVIYVISCKKRTLYGRLRGHLMDIKQKNDFNQFPTKPKTT